MKDVDVMVLGAGFVGLGTALNLLERGRSVALIDRRGAAEETSYGNAGLIQAEAIVPYAFPRKLSVILGTLAGRRTDARISLGAVAAVAPFLVAYARHASPERVRRTAEANVPIIAGALPEHRRLAERADATHLFRPTGYVKIYRTEADLESAARTDEAVRERYGVAYRVWDRARLAEEEPHLWGGLAGAIHVPEPVHLSDPGDLGKAYAALFEREGGTLARADARTLRREEGAWRVDGDEPVRARDAVIALGPWSGDAMKAQGVPIPLGIKRGYHRHYRPAGNAVLNRIVIDEGHGFSIGPNRRGLRITTGAEFARRDDPPSPVQLERVEPLARALFPVGETVEERPWLGARPCFPDLLPMLGPVPGREGLWANFGHQHHGLTLGPATGRLLAEMLTGETPYTDPSPYRVDRF